MTAAAVAHVPGAAVKIHVFSTEHLCSAAALRSHCGRKPAQRAEGQESTATPSIVSHLIDESRLKLGFLFVSVRLSLPLSRCCVRSLSLSHSHSYDIGM